MSADCLDNLAETWIIVTHWYKVSYSISPVTFCDIEVKDFDLERSCKSLMLKFLKEASLLHTLMDVVDAWTNVSY